MGFFEPIKVGSRKRYVDKSAKVRSSSRFSLMRKSGRGSLEEVLIPCFLIIQRSSSTVVGSKEESWCVGWEGSGEIGRSVRDFVEEGKLERILETLLKKKWLKELARAEGSSCEGKERLVLL